MQQGDDEEDQMEGANPADQAGDTPTASANNSNVNGATEVNSAEAATASGSGDMAGPYAQLQTVSNPSIKTS